jgi:hypothetical protein
MCGLVATIEPVPFSLPRSAPFFYSDANDRTASHFTVTMILHWQRERRSQVKRAQCIGGFGDFISALAVTPLKFDMISFIKTV